MSAPHSATAIIALAVTALLGCGPPPGPAHPVATAAPTSAPTPASRPASPATRPAAQVPARPAICRTAAGAILQAPALDLTCKHSDHFTTGSCQGQATITLVNCGPAPITLARMILTASRSGTPYTITYSFDNARVPPDGTFAREHHAMRAARFEITAELSAPKTVPWPTATLVVRNPTLEAARTRCTSKPCNGDFTRRGMLGILACSCRMPDEGKPCTDGDQCQGKCVSTPNGYRCSRTKTVFGCHNYLPRGWSKNPPTPPGRIGRKVPSICVD